MEKPESHTELQEMLGNSLRAHINRWIEESDMTLTDLVGVLHTLAVEYIWHTCQEEKEEI